MRPSSFSKNSAIALALALLLAGSMWFYFQHVMIAHQVSDAAQHDVPRGNLSDLYPRWLGARELLLRHRDPYSPEITREIQIGYYGRALDPSRPYDPKDQQGFAYPLYVVFLLAPTISLPFVVVQKACLWLLIALTVLSLLLWLRTLRWSPGLAGTTIVVVLTLGSFQVLQGIKLQQLSLLVSALIAGCIGSLAADYLAGAGILLALATIKPQLALPLAAWLLIWAFSDWRTRKNFIGGFLGAMAAFVVGAEYLLPGWIGRFHQAVIAYRIYNDGAGSVLDDLITPLGGRVATALIVLFVAGVCWRFRRVAGSSEAWSYIAVLVLAVTVVIVPKSSPYNQVLLLPGILFLMRYRQRFWGATPLTSPVVLLSIVVIAWPWIAAFALATASLFLPTESVQKAWTLPAYTILAIPILVAALLAAGVKPFAESELAQ
jgi:hypothetical protein